MAIFMQIVPGVSKQKSASDIIAAEYKFNFKFAMVHIGHSCTYHLQLYESNYLPKTKSLSAASESGVEYKLSKFLNLSGASTSMQAICAQLVDSAFMKLLSTQ